ncbi:MAG: AbrB family transcriptional regulator [Clostridiales bacterium GWF2_38_85]|nr:MAG: AbrB family transcriptional regulator [Clostridiales bacterium GWF2_38_85]HBL83625.1 AbrB family transcriptional regulator [Clostridiales bacterium]
MKLLGIVRKMDELGRVVIPKELRDVLNISIKDPVEIFGDGDKIVVRKFNASCIFCGNIQKAMIYKGKFVCDDCIQEIKADKVN